MAIEQKRKVIGNTTYLVTTMDGISALRVKSKLIKILGAGVTELKESELKEMTKGGFDVSKALDFLKPVLNNFDDELVVNFVLSLFEQGVMVEKIIDGKTVPQPLDFQAHFAGNIMEVWKVVAFILQVNFSMPGK